MRPAKANLDLIFAALANPARRAILEQLSEGEATVGSLAERSALQQPAISKHITVLEEAGLVTRTREAQWRRCALQPEALREAFEWLGDYQKFWEGSLDRLEAHIQALMRHGEDADE